MAASNDAPPWGFPKSIHGYSVGAVDDYVRKINTRLESLLMQVQTERNRADESNRVLEQMTSELEATRRKMAEWEQREADAQEARKRSEEQYASLQQELNAERESARLQREKFLSDARQHPVATVTEEQHKDTSNSRLLRDTEAQRDRLEAEIEAQRTYARSQIELVVAEARRKAEEAGAAAAAVYHEHEEHVRALGAECEALAVRTRQAMEAQLSQIPYALHSGGEASAAPGKDEPDEKRQRDWRAGDWRSSSDWRNASSNV